MKKTADTTKPLNHKRETMTMSNDKMNRYQIRIDGRLVGHIDGLTAGEAEENARSKFRADRYSRVVAILAEPRK